MRVASGIFVDLFDAHLMLTDRALSQISFVDTEMKLNHAQARYREEATNAPSPNFRLEYALANRHGASCRIAILATDDPENDALFRTMATLRDSPWLDEQPERRHENGATILAAALTVGTYAFLGVRH